jgi:hypothetical protein
VTPQSPDSHRRRPIASRFLIVLFLSSFGLAPTCGKRRPPLPPIERVLQRTELLSGVQQGNTVILSWPAPRRNAPDSSVQSIRRVDVYRVAEKSTDPLAMTEEEFGARATLVGSVTYDQIKQPGENITYIDTLELAAPARLRYAVRYVNQAGERAAFSNFFLMEPAARTAKAPVIIKTGKEVAETAITITWEAPTENIDGSTPVNLLGYNVYRDSGKQTGFSQTPINQTLVNGTQYQDKNFKFGEHCVYVVRAVSLGTEGAQVESLNSNSLPLDPVDTYPPAAPQHLTAAPANGRISLFWFANPEPDVAGYNIFRSTDPDLPRQWTKLTPTLYMRTTFTDERVEVGKTYYYYVVAVDTAGNISAPSEVVSETVPVP